MPYNFRRRRGPTNYNCPWWPTTGAFWRPTSRAEATRYLLPLLRPAPSPRHGAKRVGLVLPTYSTSPSGTPRRPSRPPYALRTPIRTTLSRHRPAYIDQARAEGRVPSGGCRRPYHRPEINHGDHDLITSYESFLVTRRCGLSVRTRPAAGPEPVDLSTRRMYKPPVCLHPPDMEVIQLVSFAAHRRLSPAMRCAPSWRRRHKLYTQAEDRRHQQTLAGQNQDSGP